MYTPYNLKQILLKPFIKLFKIEYSVSFFHLALVLYSSDDASLSGMFDNPPPNSHPSQE